MCKWCGARIASMATRKTDSIIATIPARLGMTETSTVPVEKGKTMRLLKRIRDYLQRPKCMNSYRCGDCVHAKWLWCEGKRMGFICKIDAR